jgi:SAM-dependent methyltransferase
MSKSMAPGWEKWNGPYRVQWRPVMDWLIRNARIEPGMRVLDIACGTGQPALLAAEKVRPGGRVTGIDIDPEMLAACSRLARQAGADNLDLVQMDMHALNFPEGSFDAVTFGFALMFARDAVKVMSEIRRVLRPGGRFALSVWDDPKRNSFFTVPFAALDVLGPRVAPDPKAPGPFRLAPNGELQSVIRAAGFSDFTVESVPMNVEAATPDELWEMLFDMAAVLRNTLEGKSDEDIAKVKASMFETLGGYMHEGRVRLHATPLCATAMR